MSVKVYRYLSEFELNCILQNNLQNIGHCYNPKSTSKINTHKYKLGVKYLHFFAKLESIYHIQRIRKDFSQKYYICTFNIPLSILLPRIGSGKYNGSGYKIDYYSVTEFAIPISKINPGWLVEYKEDESSTQKII